MLQAKEIGKKRSKVSVLDAKKGRTFVTPKNRSYIFDYKKVGNKYIFIIEYKDYRMQVDESTFNRTDIDILIDAMQNEITQ
jgi:hypothetical protein